jgi:NADPH-dependent glutamate synthase beta subunit-like oxidoreductase
MQDMPPCQRACPAYTDIPRYIQLIAEGRYDEAYMLNREANMFPSVCGRVCMHPCEPECNRQIIRGTNEAARKPVQIMLLKRFAADYSTIIARRKKELFRNEIPEGAKKVAIIGSGPAGLAAANDLALMKYDVTVFERDSVAGGMMMTILPNFRISKDIVRLEISFIEELGVKIKTNIEIGKDLTIDDLRKQGFEAVFIATGMQNSRRLGMENEDAKGVYDGLTYLRAALGSNPVKGERVLVIGGGNVAMDAARTAVRQGAKEVHVACLERWEPGHKDHMPASEHEYLASCEEGVIYHMSRAPQRFVVENGRIKGLELKGVTSVMDIDGPLKRFNPRFDESIKEFVEADVIVTTIGQMMDPGFASGYESVVERGRVVTNPETLQTEVEFIFAGGDAVTGPLSIISAVATGHRAAISIDKYLRGEPVDKDRREFMVDEYLTERELRKSHEYNWESFGRVPQVALPLSESIRTLDREIELGFLKEAAQIETERCMQCNNSWEQNEKGCIYCKGCVDVCPQDCLSLERLYGDGLYGPGKFFSGGEWHEEGDSRIVHDRSRCIRCGICSARCPANVIYFEKYGLRRIVSYPLKEKMRS